MNANEKNSVTLPKVRVIGMGGTISGKTQNQTSFQNYKAGTLLIEEMVNALPDVNKMASVTASQFGNLKSSYYTMNDLYDLSKAVDQALQDNDGVVVTTGTDTMEEIAYFLDLTVRSPKPVVFTGSMRPWTVIGSDAQANLFNAIKLAGSGKTKQFGTVVMLNDTIHAAREVTKTNSYRVDTFESPQLGALGFIDENNIRIYRAPARAFKTDDWETPFDLRKISKEDLAKVEIAFTYQDASDEAINSFTAGGAQGIVVAAAGAGNISIAMKEARKKAIEEKGIVFVTTTRTGSGNVYSKDEGIIAGDNLNPQHARIMLLLSLSFSKDYETIKEWFDKYGAPQIMIPE
jgi:L-asparaginase